MRQIPRKQILAIASVAAIITVLWFGWHKWLSRTHIAFLNYQPITLQQISRANDNSFIRISDITSDDLSSLGHYDMVMVNGMGLNLTAEQRALLQRAAEGGTPVYTGMATNPDNNITTLTEEQTEQIGAYMANGGRRNYRNLLRLIRTYIDGKLLRAEAPDAPVEKPSDYLYHVSIDKEADDDEQVFLTVSDYEAFMRRHNLYHEGARRIVVTGQMADPTDLIAALEQEEWNVYPVASILHLQEFVEQIAPDAIVNMAHGRLGDDMTALLARRNILLFDPLSVNRLTDEWEQDVAGMNGGFLSQSIVMPEIDGSIRTSAVFAYRRDADGLLQSYAIPDRLAEYVETVKRHLTLRDKANSDKRVVIVYYKGPGQAGMVASGMEVPTSLFNVLCRLRDEGYRVDGLPATAEALERDIQERGSLFNAFDAAGAGQFMQHGRPSLVTAEDYDRWTHVALRPEKVQEVTEVFGAFPGDHNRLRTEDGRLAFPCLQYGNIALFPQPMAGEGENEFQIVHGTDQVPPHSYIAPYLWARFAFGADAILHFGTHGSLEFTPRKQVALSNLDWPDRLIGPLPHFYFYSIDNTGEAMIAKRRTYATLLSYLTPPFRESGIRNTYKELTDKLRAFNREGSDTRALSADILRLATQLEITADLGLDTVGRRTLDEAEVERIENYAEELSSARITGEPYIMGHPYSESYQLSSVESMTVDPIAYSLLALDRLRGTAPADISRRQVIFNERYIEPARRIVRSLLSTKTPATDEQIATFARLTTNEITEARRIVAEQQKPNGMMARMTAMREGRKSTGQNTSTTPEELARARAINELATSLHRVGDYRHMLDEAPENEMKALVGALNGAFVAPSPGGDLIANPNVLPTGRNLFAINSEETPTAEAWDKGVELARHTIEEYQNRHDGNFPRKVSYTLWSGEFVQSGGATIAQVLYMLGVEPVRDRFGRVSDLRLIPSAELGRPRIDVVVQTSGQLRDLASSRLFLINRAVEMAASADDDKHDNLVRRGVEEAERLLVAQGVAPGKARAMSTRRVFGGLDGHYGTGIQEMVEAGNTWNDEREIADRYVENMGAFYGDADQWESYSADAFRAALAGTDVVVQPRQSNTWGALSLDHVYEFMGGMNLTVRNVTGKEPDAYFSDYRNRHHARLQDSREAIGVEARTRLFNPTVVEEKAQGSAAGADEVAHMVRNAYGWNVMKPTAVDPSIWNNIYKVYVRDEYHTGIRERFETINPAAVQEMTATMLETARKGYWKATPEQLAETARMHAESVEKYGASGSEFTALNTDLQQFIASQLSDRQAQAYRHSMTAQTGLTADATKGMVMERQNSRLTEEGQPAGLNGWLVAGCVLVVFVVLVFLWHRKRTQDDED
ncbi:MAG: cobaltochelatase subunit CobN [Clostridium sp.]|nr:cobaltochelatase subunit CobN [Clostridium sp.]